MMERSWLLKTKTRSYNQLKHTLDEVQYLLMYDSLAKVSIMYVRKKAQYNTVLCAVKNVLGKIKDPFLLIT